MKSATLFSGFEGAGVGMRAVGLEHAWGIEYDDKIADVARVNGFNTLTLNILEADPALFEPVDLLHASPPCPSFSSAKTNGEETELDIALARKTADFIEVIRPKFFTLENVYAYRWSKSWEIISQALYACGYWLDFQHVNFADYGVPQTRQRMIVRAVHNGFVPYLPKKEKWIGWYEAIEDLIPTLPASEFAPWQLARLPMEMSGCALFSRMELVTVISGDMKGRKSNEPSATIVASDGSRPSGMARAFIIPGDNASNETIRYEHEPTITVGNVGRVGNIPRAWLSQGRVVKMTARALARFQSFPDWYQLPEKNALACKGIGNACPPLGMEKIFRGLVA